MKTINEDVCKQVPEINIYDQRLLNVARALRESPNPGKFRMLTFTHPCGTPACALGHYVGRRDLQKEFVFREVEGAPAFWGFGLATAKTGESVVYYEPLMCRHFGITESEAHRLFSTAGCAHARSAIDAAEYIESFVYERQQARVPS